MTRGSLGGKGSVIVGKSHPQEISLEALIGKGWFGSSTPKTKIDALLNYLARQPSLNPIYFYLVQCNRTDHSRNPIP
jgi:hypothetical protein